MTNIATVSDEELQHTREIYADLVAEGRELDPASELDRMHARGIFPFALELIDEVLRQRKWAREMVEMAASGGRLDGYRELADELAAKDGEVERLTAERDNARERSERTANLLLGIHALLYPPPATLPDGRTFVFRPENPGPHAILQTLSDRIRALPDEIAAINAAKEQQ